MLPAHYISAEAAAARSTLFSKFVESQYIHYCHYLLFHVGGVDVSSDDTTTAQQREGSMGQQAPTKRLCITRTSVANHSTQDTAVSAAHAVHAEPGGSTANGRRPPAGARCDTHQLCTVVAQSNVSRGLRNVLQMWFLTCVHSAVCPTDGHIRLLLTAGQRGGMVHCDLATVQGSGARSVTWPQVTHGEES